MWPGIAQFGFIVSVVGLGSWIVGGTVNVFDLQATDPSSIWGRFALGLIARPQPGWGLFSVGLIPIGLAATARRLVDDRRPGFVPDQERKSRLTAIEAAAMGCATIRLEPRVSHVRYSWTASKEPE